MLDRLPPRLRARCRAPTATASTRGSRTCARNPQDLPGEFAALGVQLTDWTEDDSVAVGDLPRAHGARAAAASSCTTCARCARSAPAAFDRLLPLRTPGRLPDGPARASGAFPSQPGRTAAQERAALRRIGARRASAGSCPPRRPRRRRARNVAEGLIGRVGGSYMFAVRKPGGGALLFNGPQLGYSIPELFVELELHGPGVDVRGVTAAGVPLVGDRPQRPRRVGLHERAVRRGRPLRRGVVGGRRRALPLPRRGAARWSAATSASPTARRPPTCSTFPDAVPGAGQRTERICRTVHGPVEVRAGGTAYARRYAIWGRELETLEGLDRAQPTANIDPRRRRARCRR